MTVTLQDVFAAESAIRPFVHRTPLQPSPSLSTVSGADVRLKLDFLQSTGSFKLRGATNRLRSLTQDERARGVVAVSTGNHGRAVAAAAQRLGIRAVVVMSSLVPWVKVEGVRQFGAEIRVAGDCQDDADSEARRLVAQDLLIAVPPFDDPFVIAGQGTIGLEILRDWPNVDTVLVPLSGGGLLAGVARVLKSANPSIRVIGVSLETGGAMMESLKAGHPVSVVESETLADSLGGGIGLDNRYTFAMVRELMDEVVTVSEDEIRDGMAHLFWHDRLVVEGAGAVTAAALLSGKVPSNEARQRRIACLSCGNLVDMKRFLDIVGPAPGTFTASSNGRKANA